MAEEAVVPQNGENIFSQSWNGEKQFLSPDSEKFYIRLFLPLVKNPSSIDLNNPKVLQDIIQDIYDQNPSEDGVDIFSHPEIIFGSYKGYENSLINACNKSDTIQLSNGDSVDLSSIGMVNNGTEFSGYIDGWVADKIMLLENFNPNQTLGGYIELNDQDKFSRYIAYHFINHRVPKILESRQNNDSERQNNQPEQSTTSPVAPAANDTAATSTAATPPVSSIPNTTTEAVAESAPAAQPPVSSPSFRAEQTVVPPQNEKNNDIHLSDEGAATLVFLLASQLDQEDRGKFLVAEDFDQKNQTNFRALKEIISALQAKQGEKMSALFEKDDARQEALAKALQFSRSEKFLMDGNEVNKNTFGFGVILKEDQARLVMQWMGWNPDNYSHLNRYGSSGNILDQEIKKAENKFTIVPLEKVDLNSSIEDQSVSQKPIVTPEQVDLNSSIEDQSVSQKPNFLQWIFRRGQNNTAENNGSPQLQTGDNGSPEAAAESTPAAQPLQPTSVPASMLPVASANATANVISFEQIPPIENPFKKTYTADRIENVGWFVHRAAGLVALGAVAAVVAAPFVTGLAMGTALVWGVGATVATYGLGFGVNQLADIVRGFESPRVKQEKDDAANFEDLANTERKSLFREIYGPAIRGRIIKGLSPALQQQLAARQAEPPAPVAVAAPAPDPVAAAPAPAVATAQSAPVAAPAPEPAAEQSAPEPAPVAAAQPAPVATAAPAPAVVAAQTEPAAAQTEPAAAQTEPVAVAAQPEPVVAAEPEPVVAAEPEPVVAAEPEPVAVAPAPEPVAVAPAPEPVAVAAQTEPVVAVSHGWVDSYPYDFYLSDKPTKSINFAESSPVNFNSDAPFAKSVSLDLSYKFSTIDEFANMWGLSQQRTN